MDHPDFLVHLGYLFRPRRNPQRPLRCIAHPRPRSGSPLCVLVQYRPAGCGCGLCQHARLGNNESHIPCTRPIAWSCRHRSASHWNPDHASTTTSKETRTGSSDTRAQCLTPSLVWPGYCVRQHENSPDNEANTRWAKLPALNEMPSR